MSLPADPSNSAAALLLKSSIGQIKASAINTTSYISPSPKDLLLVLPRIASGVGSVTSATMKIVLNAFFGVEAAGHAIAEAVETSGQVMVPAAAQIVPPATERIVTGAIGGETTFIGKALGFSQAFTYMTSKWALVCFTVVCLNHAIVLNRTQIYAASRRHLALNWKIRLVLRILPIALFLSQTHSLLQALHCQTSPSYSMMKYGDPAKRVALDFSAAGGFLYQLSSTLMFWETDEDSCLAVDMIPSKASPTQWTGSLTMLWPVFRSLCISQFVETLSSAVQGQPVMAETGMSIFEHSLAFAEAEAMVNNQLGFSPFTFTKVGQLKHLNVTQDDTSPKVGVTRSEFYSRLNTPPEVLLIALISCLNHLSSQSLGVLGLQNRYRLINTGFWGLCFMGSFIWGFATFRFEYGLESGILRFPTVCIVGFIPHLLILLGILLCTMVYSIAVLLSVVSPTAEYFQPLTWRERFRFAQENMQVNIQLSTISINLQEDFYSALLRIGFTALTAASEAVYLNEGRCITVGRWTWLEEERMIELERSGAMRYRGTLSGNVTTGVPGTGSSGAGLVEEQEDDDLPRLRRWKSGYALEKTTKTLKGISQGAQLPIGADGIGTLQRGGRYVLAWDFLYNIFWLVLRWAALFLIKILDKLGIIRQSRWRTKLLDTSKVSGNVENVTRIPIPDHLDFWLLSDEGVVSLPESDDVDIEYHTKKRLAIVHDQWGAEQDVQLDESLYRWWTHGGWWGERDNSGDYIAPALNDDDDNDNTSIISTVEDTSSADADGWQSDDDAADSGGRRTPTQRSYSIARSRDNTPTVDLPLEPAYLARLLNPADAADRAEARILAHHLTADHVVTRSDYDWSHRSSTAQLLTSTRQRPPEFQSSLPHGRLTPFQEAEVLEFLILQRRGISSTNSHSSTAGGSGGGGGVGPGNWRDGAEGFGSGGPQCVVCQSVPRTVMAWPCRCLSLCEECRVSLAMNNFGTCVCCRQVVEGFSRLFVP